MTRRGDSQRGRICVGDRRFMSRWPPWFGGTAVPAAAAGNASARSNVNLALGPVCAGGGSVTYSWSGFGGAKRVVVDVYDSDTATYPVSRTVDTHGASGWSASRSTRSAATTTRRRARSSPRRGLSRALSMSSTGMQGVAERGGFAVGVTSGGTSLFTGARFAVAMPAGTPPY